MTSEDLTRQYAALRPLLLDGLGAVARHDKAALAVWAGDVLDYIDVEGLPPVPGGTRSNDRVVPAERRRVNELEAIAEVLRIENARLREENAQIRTYNEDLGEQIRGQEAQIEAIKGELQRLTAAAPPTPDPAPVTPGMVSGKRCESCSVELGPVHPRTRYCPACKEARNGKAAAPPTPDPAPVCADEAPVCADDAPLDLAPAPVSVNDLVVNVDICARPLRERMEEAQKAIEELIAQGTEISDAVISDLAKRLNLTPNGIESTISAKFTMMRIRETKRPA